MNAKRLGPASEAPPAFPSQNELGMSLRDWFAGQALVTLSDLSLLKVLSDQAKEHGKEAPEVLAKYVYELADAMLAEREKERG